MIFMHSKMLKPLPLVPQSFILSGFDTGPFMNICYSCLCRVIMILQINFSIWLPIYEVKIQSDFHF